MTNPKHIAEAVAQGATLLGSGRNRLYRTYRFNDCGHTQEIQVSKVRIGSFRCQTCLEEKLHTEAAAQGAIIVGLGRDCHYRTYRLGCGHTQEVGTVEMRRGNFRCQPCLEEKLIAEAAAHGATLLGQGRNNAHRTYRLECSHEHEVHTGAMRIGQFRCQTCLGERLITEAAARGATIVGAGRNKDYRTYLLNCGHEQEIQTGRMRKGGFRCQTCFNEKMHTEAATWGATLLGAGKNKNYRTYRLECGHEHEVQTTHMRIGNFRCQTCEETHRTLPSYVYLLHITNGGESILKLGYAKDIDFRASRYGLPDTAVIEKVAAVWFPTGNEAHAFETALHKKYRRRRIRRADAKAFGLGCGFTECYPTHLLDRLLAEMPSSLK